MSFMRKLLGRKTDDANQIGTSPAEAETLHQRAGQNDEPSEMEVAESPSQKDESVAGSLTQPSSDFVGFSDLPYPADKADAAVSAPAWETTRREESGDQAKLHVAGLRVGYASDVGQLRTHNEDTLMAFQSVHLGDDAAGPLGFFVVTDGMGGHRAGEVASSLAARLVTQQVVKKVYLPFLLGETPGADMEPLTEILRGAVEQANDRVHERVPGGGTTLTCALIMGRRAYIAHVGDSRAYLLTDYDMRQLTQDHSFVNRLIELGELSREEAAIHPQRHVLYRAVGQGDALDIDTYQQQLPPGSRLLLCSDGLSGQIPEEEIGKIIAAAATPQQACQRLVETANRAGGPDNITALVIEVPSD